MISPEEWERVKQQLAKLESENKQLIADRDWMKQVVLELLEEEDPFPDLQPEEYERLIAQGPSRQLHDILVEAEKDLAGSGT